MSRSSATWTVLTPVNESLPSWIKFGGVLRERFEYHTGYGYRSANTDSFFLQRLRLSVNLLPAPWFEAYIEAQDCRPLGIAPSRVSGSNKDLVDIRQFWVETKAGAEGWARVRVGRMELKYGAKRLIGDRDWSNSARTFDGARLVFQRAASRVDFLALAPVNNLPHGFDNHRSGENLRGIYGQFGFIPKASIEPYFLWKMLPDASDRNGAVLTTNVYTTGLRLSGKLPARFDYEMEMAKQTGHTAADSVSAWAGIWNAGYTLKVPWSPRLFAGYAYSTGDRMPGDGRNNTFDTLYPSTHNQMELADLAGWKNIKQVRGGVEVKPAKKLTLDAAVVSLGLASRYDAFYASDGSVSVKAVKGGAIDTGLGRELNFWAGYNLNPAMSFGAGVGHLFPGRFLKENTPGSPATYPYVLVEYRF